MKQVKFLIACMCMLFPLFMYIGCSNDDFFKKTFKSKHFPFSIGNYWEYRFLDNFRHQKDTIRATVTAKDLTISGVDDLWQLVWEGKHLPIADTQFVKFSDSLIAFYNYSSFFDSLILESQFQFPFQEDDTWSLVHNQGTYSVISSDFESDHFGNDFGKGFYIQRRARGDNNFSIHDNMMIVKNIGLVYRSINLTQGGPRRLNTYFLLNYHIQ